MANDELDGVIAFDNVLDRLIDAEVRARSASIEIIDMRSQVATAGTQLASIRKQHDDLKARTDRDMPKLSALWQAADELLRRSSVTGERADKLRKALNDAHDACDQIPF